MGSTEGKDTEAKVQQFYNQEGWKLKERGDTLDAELWEDLRPNIQPYVSATRLRVLNELPSSGRFLLDAGSGPVQYKEYERYSDNFEKRYCVDLSDEALKIAKAKLANKVECVQGSILKLPFEDNYFDATINIHVLYHINKHDQEAVVRELLRVTKPMHPVVILYVNPNRILERLRNFVKRRPPHDGENAKLYYYPYPLDWWSRFQDSATVSLKCNRSLTVEDSRLLIPDHFMGLWLLKIVYFLEAFLNPLFLRWGAYPMITLKKKA